MTDEATAPKSDKNTIYLVIGITIFVLLILAGLGGYLYLNLNSASEDNAPEEIAEDITPTTKAAPPTAPLRFTAARDVAWKIKTGTIFPYSFSYPETLPIVIFPDDKMDSAAIAWGNISPQENILLNMELIAEVKPEYLERTKEEYVADWYKVFSGLKGVQKIEPFTNTQGLKGYKAWYKNYADLAPNVDVFFEVPGREDLMIHMANGIIDPPVFERIIDSLKWGTGTTPTTGPTVRVSPAVTVTSTVTRTPSVTPLP